MLLRAIWIPSRHMYGDFKTLYVESIFWNHVQKIRHLLRLEFWTISYFHIHMLFYGLLHFFSIAELYYPYVSTGKMLCLQTSSYINFWVLLPLSIQWGLLQVFNCTEHVLWFSGCCYRLLSNANCSIPFFEAWAEHHNHKVTAEKLMSTCNLIGSL